MPKEKERYYLLAGMGGKTASRKKRNFMLTWAIAAGIVASAAMGGVLYLLHYYSR